LKRSIYFKTYFKDKRKKKKNNRLINSQENPIKIRSRSSIILPEFIGSYFSIYTGNNYKTVEINESMIGDKFGEYARTRKRNLNRFIKLKKLKKKRKK